MGGYLLGGWSNASACLPACACRVGSCVYGFASASHLSAFLTDHSNILAAATAAAEAQPLLRHLLHLQHYQQQQEEEAAAAAAEAAAQAAAAEGEGAAPAAGGDASTSGSAAEDAAEAAPAGDADAAAKEKEEEQAALLAAAEAEAAAAAAAAVPPIPGLRELLVGLQSLLLKVDAGTQTPTHFVEKHLDYSYEWNEWALRKRVGGEREGEGGGWACCCDAAQWLRPAECPDCKFSLHPAATWWGVRIGPVSLSRVPTHCVFG